MRYEAGWGGVMMYVYWGRRCCCLGIESFALGELRSMAPRPRSGFFSRCSFTLWSSGGCSNHLVVTEV